MLLQHLTLETQPNKYLHNESQNSKALKSTKWRQLTDLIKVNQMQQHTGLLRGLKSEIIQRN